MDSPKRILVAFSIDAVGGGRIPAVMYEAGLEVTTIGRPGLAVAASRFVSRRIETGYSPDDVRRGLEAHLRQCPDQYCCVLIADEPLLRTFVKHRASPALARLAPIVGDSERLARMLSKISFSEDARAAGIPVPAYRVLDSVAGIRWSGRPFVVKQDETMSGSGVHIVRNEAEADAMKAIPGGPLLVQDFIPGRVGATAVFFDGGKPTCWFSYYLCRNWPNAVAASSAIEIVHLPEMEGILMRLGAMTEFHGVCGIDWVMDPDTGKPVVLELNPRPTPGICVSELAGVSFSQALADVVAGEDEVQRPDAASPPMYRMFPQHLHWAIDARRPWEFLRTWANAPWHDPKLLLAQVRRVASHYLPTGLRARLKRLFRRQRPVCHASKQWSGSERRVTVSQ